MSTPQPEYLTPERLLSVFDRSPYGKLVANGNGVILLVNRSLENTFGYRREELVGQPIEILLPERLRHGHPEMRSQYSHQPTMRTMGIGRDLMARHRDGHEFPVEVGLNPLTVPGEPLYVVAAITDITERKRLENELRQANANLEEFTYVASHDLRSPLRGIADLVTWIGEDLGDDVKPEVARNLERVRLRVQKLEVMINELLTYARAGRESLLPEIIYPQRMINELLELIDPPPSFNFVCTIADPPLIATRIPLETVLRNLISNAIRHHDRQQGTIQITLRNVDGFNEWTITDDGPGIPEHSRNRLFKLFQTLTSARQAGTGIGLALSKRLVESHGGRISMESAPGKRGAMFRVLWPAQPQPSVNNDERPLSAESIAGR